jgi:hypothetical protein
MRKSPSTQPAEKSFRHDITVRYGAETADAVEKLFDKLQLPWPENGDQYNWACEGFLLFLDGYGAVLRLEQTKGATLSNHKLTRVNDNPWILQPLASVEVGKLTAEICPGTHATADERKAIALANELGKWGYHFWDIGARNVGLLPVKTVEFPDGVPVVIDRLAVDELSRSARWLQRILPVKGIVNRNDAQEKLYGDLRAAFNTAWEGGAAASEKISGFWRAMQAACTDGRLVQGWNKCNGTRPVEEANRAARAYGALIKANGERLKSRPACRSLSIPPLSPD